MFYEIPLITDRSYELKIVSILVISLLLVSTFSLLAPRVHAQGIQWIRQFGTSHFDTSCGVSAHTSGVYVAGDTIATETSVLMFVAKYDIEGNKMWENQFGSGSLDACHGISVDDSGVYVAGSVAAALPGAKSSGFDDAYVRKYDFDGHEI